MKKILIIFTLLFIIPIISVKADNLMITYSNDGENYILVFEDEKGKLDYNEVKILYGIDDYFEFLIDGNTHYFYKGEEISASEYNSGKKLEEKRTVCNDSNIFCIDINSQDELINKIDEIFTSRKIGEYHLLYSDDTYSNINFTQVNKYFQDNYMTELKKNAYKYNEYGIMLPIKFLPYHDENEMIISTMTIKITPKEEAIVDEFLESFIHEFDGKSDYEKVLGIYLYIAKTSKYESDNGYTKFVDGRISPYDVLIEHKTVCIGSSTTFQFLMERLGVESFIIDHVSSYDETTYNTTHTYNLVKLDDKWFIVDINSPNNTSSLLIGANNKYDKNDLKYLGVSLSKESYLDLYPDLPTDFNIDYDKYVSLADSLISESKPIIEQEEEVVEKEDDNKSTFKVEYIIIIGILLAICIIIFYFTRKD